MGPNMKRICIRVPAVGQHLLLKRLLAASILPCSPALAVLSISGYLEIGFLDLQSIILLSKQLTEVTLKQVRIAGPAYAEMWVGTTSSLRKLVLFNVDLSDSVFAEIVKHCPDLRHLEVNKCRYIGDESMQSVAVACPHLRELHLSDLQLTDVSVMAIGAKCAQLTHITLQHVNNLTDDSLVAIAAGCPNLTHFKGSYLGGSFGFTATGCKALTSACA